MLRGRSLGAVVALAAVAMGCGSAGGESDDTISPVTPSPTLAGVGAVPPVPAVPAAVREPVVVVRPPVNADGTDAQLIGEAVDGNRILMIGDSILASTSSRYGDHMCNAVVPLGWEVAVEAEPSQFVEFGNRVLDRLLIDDAGPATDWDAAVVFLGSNYRGDAFAYEAELIEILDRLDPRPVVLLTVTEYRPNYVDVNVVVNRLGAQRDNVTVLDWSTISATPGVLSGDRLHPTDSGRRILAESVAAALGPVDGVGECLRSTFRDDSAVGGDRTAVLGRPSTGSGSSRSGSATTTVRSSPTTTVASGGGGGGGVDPTTVPSGPTTPPTTAPTTTSPAPTATLPDPAPPPSQDQGLPGLVQPTTP